MRHSAALLATACALGASAWRPAGITPESDAALSLPHPVNALSQLIQIPCASCAFESKYEIPESVDNSLQTPGDENSLVLHFTISEDRDRLLLNGESIYPMHPFNAGLSPRLYVHQIPWSVSPETLWPNEIEAPPLEITGSMTLTREGEAEGGRQDDFDQITVTFGILSVEHQPVAVDQVSVRLLRTYDRKLLILALENIPHHRQHTPILHLDGLVPAAPPMALAEEQSQDCDTLCRWKAIIGSKVQSLRQGALRKCGGRKVGVHGGKLPTHIRPHFLHPDLDETPERHHGRPHHMRPHGAPHRPHAHHHHHHHHHRGFMHTLARGFVTILVPTLAGVVVGMAVSVLGLALARLVAFLWTKAVHGGRCGYEGVPQDATDAEKVPVDADEEVEPLPVYERAPTYEDAIAERK